LRFETHLSAQSAPARQDARVSIENEDAGRPKGPEAPAAKGPASPDSMKEGSAPHAFPKHFRLLRRADFRTVYEQGQRRSASLCTVFWHSNGLKVSRLGITVPVRVGGAVVRNRIKRRVREVFRLNRTSIPAGWDIVVNPRSGAAKAAFPALSRDLLRTFPREEPRKPSQAAR
jgi:ribonuclease P protein component